MKRRTGEFLLQFTPTQGGGTEIYMKNTFRKYISSDLFTVKYAKGTSDMRGKEFHTYHEIIFFMGGKGRFICDNYSIDLKQNMVMIIPKASYHRLNITGCEEEYRRCIIHFNDIPPLKELIAESLDKTTVFDADMNIRYLLYKVIGCTDSTAQKSIKENIVLSVIVLLLEKVLGKNSNYIGGISTESVPHKCIEIINRNLCGNISVPKIAEELSISQSALSHIFKKEMNISVYKYILEKRLVLAYEKILDGQRATEAALECGFNDYSGFYKQYKKMFGITPAETEEKKIRYRTVD